ncbi:TfoX/Sxy family protein [Lysobacter humi (ex Lee et al. 2017)]
MATDAGTIDFLLDQLGGAGSRYSTKRMFGEHCLYRDGSPIALVCDDVLFVKDTMPGREQIACFATLGFGPPYPGAKPHLRLPPDTWDDADALRRVLEATAAALPPAKPRKAAPKTRTGDGPASAARARKRAGNGDEAIVAKPSSAPAGRRKPSPVK